MVVVASGMYAGGGFSEQHRNLLIGAILFYISDITVARDRFESDLLVPEFNPPHPNVSRFVSPGFLNPLVGLPLYYVAQLIIATPPIWCHEQQHVKTSGLCGYLKLLNGGFLFLSSFFSLCSKWSLVKVLCVQAELCGTKRTVPPQQ